MPTIDPAERCCRTCKWANLPMTNHRPPRIDPRRNGTCEWPIPFLPLPACISVYGVSGSLAEMLGKGVIWSYSGGGCTCWERKDA